MSDTEEQRKYYERMIDEHRKLIANLKAEREVKQLKDENERLRSCLSDSAENSKQIMHEAHVQAEENEKLRELVRDYIDAPCTTCDCWQDEFRCWNYDGADCGLVARARELGVEV